MSTIWPSSFSASAFGRVRECVNDRAESAAGLDARTLFQKLIVGLLRPEKMTMRRPSKQHFTTCATRAAMYLESFPYRNLFAASCSRCPAGS